MKMFIDGKPVDAGNKQTIDVLNSATQEKIDTVPMATVEDIQHAVNIAQKGKKLWGATPMYARARILYKCADVLESHVEELAVLLSTEMGKIIREARGEVDCAVQILRAYVEKAKHLYGETMPTEIQSGCAKDIIFTRREPLGAVACIAPFNYPVELCMHKVASALSAGNSVLVKPATDNPLTLLRIVELMLGAGVPGEALQIITGPGPVVGRYLVESDKIDAVSFTGSTEVGQGIARAAAGTLKHIFLELGGNDPFIVFDDAGMELAVNECAGGRIQNAGQTCCSPKRFFIQNTIKDRFVELLIERLKKVRKGSPQDEETELGAMINPKAVQEVRRQVELTLSQGAKCIYGGTVSGPAYYDPTVLVNVTPEMDISGSMEVFGPVFPIIGFDTEEELIAMANNTSFGLNAGILTGDIKRAFRVAAALECGSVVINGSGNYRNIDQPHGGRKLTGLGREGICCTLEEMTQTKAYILKGVLAGA
ncbi:MAG: aldehyde dehydrogenase family protein [Treponema sp.]|jgi:succinate-semialdehyde dehydrogenase/glutarate-semialdehyde dehydrogenase|nr:aldehyde dehydrogenase family protein [Treponema sp.]